MKNEELEVKNELPTGWIEIPFKDVKENISTTNKKLLQKEYSISDGEIPVIDQGISFIGGYSNKKDLAINASSYPHIIFGDHTKIIKYVNFDFIAGADGTKILKPLEMFYPKAFYYFIKMIKLPDKGYARHFQFLEKSLIKIPPINEQKRIVAKIEKLFSNLDNSDKYLLHLEKQLKRYRQSVLKSAFEGELTKEWREKQTNLETADELLEKIKIERILYVENEIREKFKDKTEKWIKDKVKNEVDKFYSTLKPIEDEEKISIPKSWSLVQWEQVLAYGNESFKRGPFGSALTKSFFVDHSPYKVYEQYCPINDDCSYERYYITEDKFNEMKTFEVKAKDFLISCSGVSLGRITQVPDNYKKGVINQALLRVRLNREYYLDDFFVKLFRSQFFQTKIFENSTGSAIPNVKGVKELKSITLPFVTIKEQQEIVNQIEKHFSIIDKLETVVKQSIKESKRLRQSILKQAFEGKLVEQDPNDESASVLLEKIAKAKEEYQKAQKKQVRKK